MKSLKELFVVVEKRVGDVLSRYGILQGVSHLGLAVSGGSDSMALLYLLHPLCRQRGVEITVLHFNHRLRGAASDGDEVFVRECCKKLGIAFTVGYAADLHSPEVRREGGRVLSLEMAAREARHSFFRQQAQTLGLDGVALGHHCNDVSETLLLRLVRGSGAAGLGGMRPRAVINGVCYLRPLLDCDSSELRLWLKGHNYTWREDATNNDVEFQRNMVRQKLMPTLRSLLGESLDRALARSAELLREDDAVLEALADEVVAGASGVATLQLAPLEGKPLAIRRRAVYGWLLREGGGAVAGFEVVQRILERCNLQGEIGRVSEEKPGQTLQEPEWQMSLPGGHLLRCRNGKLRFIRDHKERQHSERLSELVLPRDRTILFNGVKVVVKDGTGFSCKQGEVGVFPAQCALSAAALQGRELVVRYWQPGDRISPTGMGGSRKVQDVFTDVKIPREERDKVPLLVCDNEVVWVPGYRVAAKYAVPAADGAAVVVEMSLCGMDSD
ncbi:MAG: tRNA lysidine(34) synthetase TilS [Lentisphaerae bacterium]|nr:tRNA lysidine(34) synthetase TilS [Lentisphaerota bacterium]